MLTYDQIFGPGKVFCPAAIGKARRWLPSVPETLTGGQIPFVGDMPCFSHIACATKVGLRHLAEAGHCLPGQLQAYHDERELLELIRRHVHDGRKIVASHLPYPGEFAAEDFWVVPEVVSRINNKGQIGDWVPRESLSNREVVPTCKLRFYQGALPVVIKIATHMTTGGGVGVLCCNEKHALLAAEEYFRDSETVVIEQWVDYKHSWCLNYACYPEGRVECLGAALQIIDGNLQFKGNLFPGLDFCSEPLLELGESVSRRIAASGYYGVVGIDVGQTADDRYYVFDINGRMNASTTPLLALQKFPWLKRYPMQMTVRIYDDHSIENAISLSEQALSMKRFLPLSTFVPSSAGFPGRAFVAGMLAGESEADISVFLARQLGQRP